MSTEKIIKIVDQIQEKINEIRNELGQFEIIKEKRSVKIDSKSKKKNKGVDLLQPIKKLYNDNFFIECKSDLEVKEKLELDLLTDKSPKRASIANALRKMVKIGLLVREKNIKNKKATFCYKNRA
ncbi:MAG: hypothetical protein WCT37_03985 [Patescibacteria group bacterium]|jgi:hypothetical protein